MLKNKSDFLKLLFQNLNKNEVNYFVIGEYGALPESTGSSDLDVVVEQKHLQSFLEILKSLLSQLNINVVSFYTNNNSVFYRLAGRGDKYWGLQLDILYRGFYFQNKEYFPIDLIKNDIIIHNDIRVLNLKKTYFLGFLKEIIHKGWAKDKYIKGFLVEVKSNEIEYRDSLNTLYGEKFASLVFDDLTFDNLKSNAKTLGEAMFKKVYNNQNAFITNVFAKSKYLKRIFKQPGYAIAFLGTDGAGKSTIIEKITPILNESFHNSVNYEHLRPNMIPSIAQLLGKKEIFDGPVTNPHEKKQSGLFGSLLRWSYYLIDYTLGYLLKVFPKKAFRSCVWIFDRYYYDYLIDKRRTRVNLPNWILKIGKFIIPEPDIIICLGAEPNIIYARKPELSIQEVNRQVKELKLFCSKNDRAIWIDTSVSVEESVNETMQVITNTMSNRFKSNR